MSTTGEGQSAALAELRARIDAIDETVHRALIERSAAIDSLIRVKGTSLPGAAFRPGREADMMRRLVARHRGALPLTTVEHIWREIITAFTNMQARFGLAVDGGAPAAEMRDLARFYFGFSVAVTVLPDAAATVARVRETGTDLGLIGLSTAPATPWWRGLGGRDGPHIMAMLPFIRAAARPASLPALVVSPPLSDPVAGDIAIFAASAETAPAAFASGAAAVFAETRDGTRWEALVAVPAGWKPAEAGTIDLRPVGSIARGIALDGSDDLLYRAVEPEGAVS